MDPLSIIQIHCDANYAITSMNENGLKYLGYDDIQEIEFKCISTIIPQPSAALHRKIFREMSNIKNAERSDKSKYFKIAELADEKMNTSHIDTQTHILSKLQSKEDTKSVLTKDGTVKLAYIYVDMLFGRDCNVYMYPIDDNEIKQADIKCRNHHPDLTKYTTNALVDILRKIRRFLYM
jgi:hypothetical protein